MVQILQAECPALAVEPELGVLRPDARRLLHLGRQSLPRAGYSEKMVETVPNSEKMLENADRERESENTRAVPTKN